MAISQMRKISFLFNKEILDDLLVTLQELESVEIRDISQLDSWKSAFESQEVTIPQVKTNNLMGESPIREHDYLHVLQTRQAELEKLIATLSNFLPKESKISALKKGKQTVSLEQLFAEDADKRFSLVQELLTQRINKLENVNKKISELKALNASLSKWLPLKTLPIQLSQYQFLQGAIGTIPNTADGKIYEQLKKNSQMVCEEIFHDETEIGLLLFWNKEDEVNLEEYHFLSLDYQESKLPEEVIKINNDNLAKLEKEKIALESQLGTSGQELLQLQIATDAVIDTYNLHQSKSKMASTSHLVTIQGWSETQSIARVKEVLTKKFGQAIMIDDQEVTEADWEKVPIKLKNHPLISPFELITEMYALPKYNEKDPTPFLAPFYFAFFGMMVADLGYGLLLFVATFLALKLFSLQEKQKRFLSFFNILGLAVSLWGLIYGSFFGFNLPFAILSTQTDVMSILILSVIFGFITVIVGLVLGGLQEVKMKDYGEAYRSGFAWCFILIGLLLIAIGLAIPKFVGLLIIGKWLAIINAIGIVIVAVVKAKSLKGIGSGLYNLYNISSYIGDLVSFTRLMALGLSGASIGSAFNLIVGIFPPVGRFTIGIILFILLHAINIFLSLLSGYVHGARLMFVEFFGKFYQGGGQAFQPLKYSEKYLKINREEQLEEK